MARAKNFEIIRRLQTASRQTNAPQLQVNADQDAARGAGGMLTGIAGVMGDAMPVVDKVKGKIDTDNLNAGTLAQEQAALLGKSAKDDPRYAANAKFAEGVDMGDAMVRYRDIEKTLVTEVAQLEPDADIDEFLNTRIAAVMGDPANLSPAAQKVLIPALGKMRENLQSRHLDASIKETLQKQEDALGALAIAGFEDGSLMSTAGQEKFINFYIDKPEFGYLTKRDMTAALARHAAEAIASGKIDPAKAFEALTAPRSDGTPGLANIPEYKRDLEQAVKVGTAVRDKAREEAQQKAEADAAFEMDSLAESGRLTDSQIKAYAARFGHEDNAGWQLMWRNRRQAAIERMEAKAAAARKDREESANLLNGNPLFMTDDKVGKSLDKMLSVAPIFAADANGRMVPTNNTMKVIRLAAQQGVAVPALKNLMQRVSPQDPQGFNAAVQIYKALKRVDPSLAAKFGDAKSIGTLHAYEKLTTTGGYTADQAREALANKVYDEPGGKASVATVWASASKGFNKTTTGTAIGNPFGYKQLIRAKAEVYAATGGLSAEEAIEAARRDVEAETTIIGGRLSSRAGMPKGAEKATEELVSGVGKKLIAAGKYPKGTQFFAVPTDRDPARWVVINTADGIPAEDTNGGPVVFSPAEVAKGHAQWTTQRTQTAIQTKQAMKAAGFSGKSGDPLAIKANVSAQIADLEKKAAAAEKSGGLGPQYAKDIRRTIGQLKKQLTTVDTVVPTAGSQKEFIDFISGN